MDSVFYDSVKKKIAFSFYQIRYRHPLIQAIYRTCLAGDSETPCGLPSAREHHVGDPCAIQYSAERKRKSMV